MILEPRQWVLRRLRRRFARLPDGESLADELISDRRDSKSTENWTYERGRARCLSAVRADPREALGVELHAFDLPMARPTAEMWVSGKGLSLGDLACMALAKEVHGTAVTTASGWMAAGADILAIQ